MTAFASSGVLTVLSALFQLMKDQASYEKELEVQQKQFQFTLGAASHMANTAFDMHVNFCEKYMDEVHAILHTLFREGDTAEVLGNAGNLHQLREDFAVWLTDEIDEKLGKFEQGIRKLGADAQFIETTRGVSRYSEQRSIKIDSNFKLFSDIFGFDKDAEIHEDYAIESTKKKVREILGVEELTGLRTHLLKEASNVLAKNT